MIAFIATRNIRAWSRNGRLILRGFVREDFEHLLSIQNDRIVMAPHVTLRRVAPRAPVDLVHFLV